MKIALDVMGGDHAPVEMIAGAVAALSQQENLRLYLVGDQEKISENLTSYEYPSDRVELIHASDVVGMKDDPLVKKPDSSLNIGLSLVKDGTVEAFVSAGNTGALMSRSLLTLGRIPAVKRPAIATTIPRLGGHFLLLDAGANTENRPEHLYQFALMGSIFAKEVYGKEFPKIGVLNIGTEKKKGPKVIQELYSLLEADNKVNFVGNVEGHSLFFSDVDVVVTDGYTGNIALKLMEGFAMYLLKAFESGLSGISGIETSEKARVLNDLRKMLDSSEYGGAPLLGVSGISIKAHGGSKRKAITNALKYAYLFSSSDAMTKFKEYFKNE